MKLTKHCKGCNCSKCRWQKGNCPYGYCWECDGDKDVVFKYQTKTSWCKYFEPEYRSEEEKNG